MNPFSKPYLVLAFLAVLSTFSTTFALHIITDNLAPPVTTIDFVVNCTWILLAISVVIFTCALYFLAVKSIIVEVRDQAIFKKMSRVRIPHPGRSRTSTNTTHRPQHPFRKSGHWPIDDDE
jgi:hypothetical protein